MPVPLIAFAILTGVPHPETEAVLFAQEKVKIDQSPESSKEEAEE